MNALECDHGCNIIAAEFRTCVARYLCPVDAQAQDCTQKVTVCGLGVSKISFYSDYCNCIVKELFCFATLSLAHLVRLNCFSFELWRILEAQNPNQLRVAHGQADTFCVWISADAQRADGSC
eukprot:scaffold7522_cov417-Prasinococcus_capsulatus_cf.AAC.6